MKEGRMELKQAKQAVLEAARNLLSSNLVARTWGNISCRVGEESFLITPSGKAYEHLSEDQLVLVSLSDLSYSGRIKPSSEKGMHASVYRNKPAVQCVLHTHQEMASLASLLGQSVSVSLAFQDILGTSIPTASYGLPGTKRLHNNVTKVLQATSSSSLLMACHGALCFGPSIEASFAIAQALEQACKEAVYVHAPMIKALEGTSSIKLAAAIRNTGSIEYGKALDPTLQQLCAKLLTDKTDCNTILLLISQEVLAVMDMVPRLAAYLDDFAQIAAPSLAVMHQNAPVSKLLGKAKHCDALLMKGLGALCMGNSETEAHAVATLVQKNCKAEVLHLADLRVRHITWLDARLMRYVYKQKYSKLA